MKDKVLDILRKAGNYVSGENICKQLGVTRTAIWKIINVLKTEGYYIESVNNKGYKLLEIPDIFNSCEILIGLTTKYMGRNHEVFKCISSTNEVAKQKAFEGAVDGSLYVAEMQSRGKGRLGKSWHSPTGTGLWMSLVLRPQLDPEQLIQITLVSGVSVCQAIRTVTGLDARIKWPNDIVVNGKKICGILTEMVAEQDCINCVIVGIGVNVNTPCFPNDISDIASSIFIESGVKYKRVRILRKILEILEINYEKFIKTGFAEDLLMEYKDLCINLGREVSFVVDGKMCCGVAKDILPSGQLIIEANDGKLFLLKSGECSIRGIYGYV